MVAAAAAVWRTVCVRLDGNLLEAGGGGEQPLLVIAGQVEPRFCAPERDPDARAAPVYTDESQSTDAAVAAAPSR